MHKQRTPRPAAEVEEQAETRQERVARLIESARFQRAIIGLIVFNAATLGLETFDAVMARAGDVLHALDRLVLAVFVLELALRFYAYRWRFFRDPWNVFDFAVVTIS